MLVCPLCAVYDALGIACPWCDPDDPPTWQDDAPPDICPGCGRPTTWAKHGMGWQCGLCQSIVQAEGE